VHCRWQCPQVVGARRVVAVSCWAPAAACPDHCTGAGTPPQYLGCCLLLLHRLLWLLLLHLRLWLRLLLRLWLRQLLRLWLRLLLLLPLLQLLSERIFRSRALAGGACPTIVASRAAAARPACRRRCRNERLR